MEGDIESKPKTLINNTQPTDESAGSVASKIRQFGKGFRIPDDGKERGKKETVGYRIRRI